MHNNVHCSIIYNSQDMKATCPSTEKQIKMWRVYTYTCAYICIYKHSGTLLSHLKKSYHLQQHG